MNKARAAMVGLAVLAMVACARRGDPEAPATGIPTTTQVAAQANETPTRPADDIDARLTNVALTVHPQLTQTALAPQQTATAVSAITVNAPPPTATIAARAAREIFANREIRIASWSPDSQWIAFWILPVNPVDPDAGVRGSIPVFYEVATGQTCMHRDYVGFIANQYSETFSYWLRDGRAVIVADGTPYSGEPCVGFEAASPEYAVSPWNRAYSPDGSYRAESSYNEETRQVITVITDAATGAQLNQVEWTFGVGQRPELGGRWITNDLFLLSSTEDRGPLLVEVGSADPIEVLPELFNMGLDRPGIEYMYATAAEDAIAGNYHVLLHRRNIDSALNLLLYHSETGTVETLTFNDVSGMTAQGHYIPGFSPDGEWLLLQDTGAQAIVWKRPVDGSDDELVRLGQMIYTQWSGPTNLIAYKEYVPNDAVDNGIIIASFPEGRVLSHWVDDDMIITPYGFSPDGTRLLAHGFVPSTNFDNWREALFLIEP